MRFMSSFDFFPVLKRKVIVNITEERLSGFESLLSFQETTRALTY